MASKTKKLAVLQEIYAQIPNVDCKGLCWNACAAILVGPYELLRLQTAAGLGLETLELEDAPPGSVLLTNAAKDLVAPCPLLVAGRCSVYETRPIICRVFGVAEGLPCPHGCTPAKMMTDDQVMQLVRRVNKL